MALSDADEVVVSLPGGASATLTRAELEARCAELLERCALPVREVLLEAQRSGGGGVRREELAAVLLVGGATRMPAVRALVERETGQPPRHGVDPDEVVALGCAVQAAALVGQLRRGDAIVLDETPDVEDLRELLAEMQRRTDGERG